MKSCYFIFFLSSEHLYGICLIRMKDQIRNKRRTVGTNRNSNCEKHANTTKTLSIKTSRILMISVADNFLAEPFFFKIRYLYQRWPFCFFFLWNKVELMFILMTLLFFLNVNGVMDWPVKWYYNKTMVIFFSYRLTHILSTCTCIFVDILSLGR